MAIVGARAIGALVIGAAVLCAVSDASCARWSTLVAAPAVDWSTTLTHCEAFVSEHSAIDVARPVVLASAVAGGVLAGLVKVDETRGLILCAMTLLVAALVGRAFAASASCLAAAAIAAVVVNAIAPAKTSRSTAMTVAAIGAAIAPLAV